jgi:glycosyltransferase involved in cell wall biosynthesis
MSNQNELVSIVTPSYNQVEYLRATIDSVLEQDYANTEYIIVDGGSKDGSDTLIREYEHRLAWWVSERDEGQTDAINKGFARARGQILAWLNSDDTYQAGAIAAAVKYLQEHPEVGMVYGDANYIDERGRVIGKFPAAQTDYRRLRKGFVHIPQQASFFRVDLWREVGPLDPSFYFAMDYDLWVRIASKTKIKYLSGQTWANFRLHTSGKTISADDRCWPEMLRVHYRDGGSIFAQIVLKYYIRKLIAPWWNWRRRRLIRLKP